MPWWWGRWRRRGWRRRWGRRRGRRVRRGRTRRAFPRRRRGRYVSRRWRRPYRRRRRKGRRRRRRRRTHKPTLIMRQWQPDVVRTCYITGWMPLIICGQGQTQFNFIMHMDDITPRGASYGGNLTNITWTLEGLWEQFQYHRNRWSRSNHDLDLARYMFTTLKFYRHDSVDYIVSYTRTGPFQMGHLTHLSTHPLLMLLSKHHLVVPSLKTKPGGRKYKKIRIKPPKLMLNKWYFTKDICDLGLFQLWATGAELRNPWLRSGTQSPCIGFSVLNNSYYTNLNTDTNKNLWQYTYTGLMSKYYYKGNQNSTYDFQNYSNNENYKKTYTKWKEDKEQRLQKLQAQWQKVYPQLITQKPEDTTLLQDFGIYSPFYLTPVRISLDWRTTYTHVRYNPLTDKGIGNRVYLQWCSESSCKYSSTKSKCPIVDMPLFIAFYGYIDWCIKCTGNSGLVKDARIMVRCPYTEPQLVGATEDVGFCLLSNTFMNGDMPVLAPYIPISWFVKWYPMIAHQKETVEAIVSCGPFMPRDQEAKSWDITMGYRSCFKWGGSPLPTQAIDDPCQKPTHPLPDPDRHPRLLQVSDPTKLGPKTIFHRWDMRRGQFSKRSIERMSEYTDYDEYFETGLPSKRKKFDTPAEGLQGEQREAYDLLQALQASQEESGSEDQEQAPPQETQTQQLLQQLQLQKHHQRVLRQGLKHLLGDVLRLRRGVHWDPLLT
uniref:Capsid protein n=1 Tax=Alphatorquevirus homin29 TaxID=3048427 RepID=A0AAU8H5R2_9VIRU